MSRNRPLTRPEDGVCPVTGLDVPDDGDGQLVKFSEKKGRVITREQLIKSGFRAGAVAANPKDTLMNVAYRIIDVLSKDVTGELKGVDPVEFDRLVSIMNVSSECLSDQDYGHLYAHLRNKGLLHHNEL